MNITVRPPLPGAEMDACFELRWLCLRKPWGQVKGSEKDERESECIHMAAFNEDGEVVATGRLQFNSPEEGQIRYMAVHPDHQNKEIGKSVLEALEKKASGKAKYLILEARDLAVSFYKRAGYKVIEKTFLLYNDIQHFRMKKTL